jgi:hypothetical protein
MQNYNATCLAIRNRAGPQYILYYSLRDYIHVLSNDDCAFSMSFHNL